MSKTRGINSTRACSRKRVYDTEEQARAAAKRTALYGDRRKLIVAYKCPVCSGYHIGRK